MERVLLNQEQANLRLQGVIYNNEIAIQIGDLFVAEDVVSRTRRVINIPDQMMQENRKLLRD